MRKFTHLLSAVIFAFAIHINAGAQTSQTIFTLAGTGIEGLDSPGHSLQTAQLHWPTDVKVVPNGDIYVADALNNIVRKITGDTIKTIAGNAYYAGTGMGAYGGDGGPATAAALFYPSGIAISRTGNIYIADQKNHRIRKIDTGGTITTVAGTGAPGYSGDTGPAISAQVQAPTHVAVDTLGNVYIADAGNHCIRKIDTFGFISTIAGTGIAGFTGDGGAANAAQLNGPSDMVVDDSTSSIYVADTYNNRIRKIDNGGGINTFAGNGLGGFGGDGHYALEAAMFEPSGIAIDTAGNLYITSIGDSRLRKINASDSFIHSIAGTTLAGYNGDNRSAITAQLWFPQGVAVNKKGDIFVADQGNNRVRVIITAPLGAAALNAAMAGISLYPNPSNGMFTVNASADADEPVQMIIASITGEKIYESHFHTNTPTPVNFSQPAGMYVLSIITSRGVLNDRLIIR